MEESCKSFIILMNGGKRKNKIKRRRRRRRRGYGVGIDKVRRSYVFFVVLGFWILEKIKK